MKYMKIVNIVILSIMTLFFTSCFKNNDEEFYLKDFRAEFQDAVITTNTPGLNYPFLKDLRSKAGLQKYQVNLLGGLKDKDQVFTVKILAESTAKVNQHYLLPKGAAVTIPANQAMGYFEVEIPELTNTVAVDLIFELVPNDDVKVNANYKTLGLKIRK